MHLVSWQRLSCPPTNGRRTMMRGCSCSWTMSSRCAGRSWIKLSPTCWRSCPQHPMWYLLTTRLLPVCFAAVPLCAFRPITTQFFGGASSRDFGPSVHAMLRSLLAKHRRCWDPTPWPRKMARTEYLWKATPSSCCLPEQTCLSLGLRLLQLLARLGTSGEGSARGEANPRGRSSQSLLSFPTLEASRGL